MISYFLIAVRIQIFRYNSGVTKKETVFQEFILDWYEKCGRYDLPWRQDHDPYKILVSELMLQQTQVVRVVPKFEAFITKYPTVQILSQASLGDVIRMWQGLGYNRRAKFLLQCAQVITSDYKGRFPTEYEELLQLPGIGPYTASAICAFAYNQTIELIETNVRQVYIYHFFKNREEVTDAEILEKVRRTVPTGRARQWYAALMDYGTHLKSLYGNNTRIIKGYTKQSKFKGSNREVRGAILRVLAEMPRIKPKLWAALSHYDKSKIQPQLDILMGDEMVIEKKGKYQLP
jgi:A/G-specific adenine glycosylase